MDEMDKLAKKRLMIVLIIALVGFAYVVGNHFYWQIYKGNELKRGALGQWTRGETIKPKRGFIYDRNGKKLAVNQNASTVWVDTAQVNKKNKARLVDGLSTSLSMDKEEVNKLVSKENSHVKVKQWITEDELKSVNKLIKEAKLNGITVVDDYIRYYPYNDFASHVLGFTDIDNNGLYGIEQMYDKQLLGNTGKWVRITDQPGKQLPFEKDRIYDAKDGLSLVLTIDETIQQFAEKAVEKSIAENNAENISVIALDPKTAEVLAFVNKPDYNPNNPREPLNEVVKNEWETLAREGKNEELEEKWYDSWRNYGINDIYEPGSTFKLVTAAAAIEENKVNKNTPFYCGGIMDVSGTPLRCASWRNPHGALNFKKGVSSSCNIVFINTAKKLGTEEFLKYIKAFGFGQKTGIDLNGEEYGLVANDPDKIQDVQLATMSFGQGIAVTPIQMINAVAAVTNGGNLMKPRVVKALVDSDGNVVKEFKPEVKRKVISESTSEQMLELMEAVVAGGGGKNAFIPGYRIGGKTGTAEKPVDGGYADGQYIGSFAAVAPIEDPRIVLLVIVDNPEGTYYGGTTAAPIAKEIIENTMKYLEIDPVTENQTGSNNGEIVQVPNIVGMSIGEAGISLRELELRHMTNYVDIDTSSIVIEQNPPAGTNVQKGTVIDLKVEEGSKKVIVPDLKGKTKDEIKEILKDTGLKYKIKGNHKGKCVKQSPKADSQVERGVEINLKLE